MAEDNFVDRVHMILYGTPAPRQPHKRRQRQRHRPGGEAQQHATRAIQKYRDYLGLAPAAGRDAVLHDLVACVLYLRKLQGDRATYEILQSAADDVIARSLPRDHPDRPPGEYV